ARRRRLPEPGRSDAGSGDRHRPVFHVCRHQARQEPASICPGEPPVMHSLRETTEATQLVTLDEIRTAAAALPSIVRRTPIVPFAHDNAEIGAERLFLKLENLQVTGAYKVRAAFTVLAALSRADRSRGIALMSSGNFAQAFALAGRVMGVPIAVVMLAS